MDTFQIEKVQIIFPLFMVSFLSNVKLMSNNITICIHSINNLILCQVVEIATSAKNRSEVLPRIGNVNASRLDLAYRVRAAY